MKRAAIPVDPEVINAVRTLVIVPLKDAMKMRTYSESNRNRKYYKTKKSRSGELHSYTSYSFKLWGTIKHEMYLKAIHPPRIKTILGKNYSYKLIITPNRPINLNNISNNLRKMELVIYVGKDAF